ncbi:MAG: hypothetical protein J0647_07785 [Campylobacteraceae bacterium]|nr:hypothetical protein [Campylobacteraceae bacterium]
MEDAKITLPTPEEFFLKKGLYEPISLGEEHNVEVLMQILQLEFFDGAIRTYCLDCKQESIFRTDLIKRKNVTSFTTPHVYEHLGTKSTAILYTPKEVYDAIAYTYKSSYGFKNRTFTLEFYCTHNHSHRIFFTFNITDGFIQKIGQYPSVANSLEEEIKVYKRELGKDKGEEFSKAIGLFSHGVGIGAFVYLRRIFESFIYEAKDKALNEGVITNEEFNQRRMSEKIELLSAYLPKVIVERKDYYGVVSKGIHELSEDECKKYFLTLKNGIELILDEKIAEKQAKKKRELFEQELSKITQKINTEN